MLCTWVMILKMQEGIDFYSGLYLLHGVLFLYCCSQTSDKNYIIFSLSTAVETYMINFEINFIIVPLFHTIGSAQGKHNANQEGGVINYISVANGKKQQ